MEMEYIQAPWVITEPDPKSEGIVLVQNNLNRKRWRLKKNIYGNPLGNGASPEVKHYLKAEKLIMSLDETIPILEEEVKYHLYGFSKNAQIATLIPTHACQFGCPYCYNINLRDPKKESRLPSKTVASKIGEFFRNSPAQKWNLHVIGGGEPLLASNYILDVATTLRKMAGEEGRNFDLDVVTNGHLLHGEILTELIKAGLRKVRITLDPDHDKSRPLANGEPTFDKIFSNLKALPEEIELQLGSNVPLGKTAEFAILLEKLEPLKRRVTDFNVSLILEPLIKEVAHENTKSSHMYGPAEVDFLLSLIGMIDDAGFQRKNHYPQIECEAGRLCEKLVINMRGETTCCAGLDGFKEYQTELANGIVKGSMNYRVTNDQTWKKHCFSNGSPCAYLPLCHTGCRLISISKGLGWWAINCEKLYLDRLTRYELRRWAA